MAKRKFALERGGPKRLVVSSGMGWSNLAVDLDGQRVLEAKESEENRAAGLESALNSLDARSRRIVEARWLREKDPATLHDLAAEFKVSAERIRQIEAKALEKMRKALPAPA